MLPEAQRWRRRGCIARAALGRGVLCRVGVWVIEPTGRSVAGVEWFGQVTGAWWASASGVRVEVAHGCRAAQLGATCVVWLL